MMTQKFKQLMLYDIEKHHFIFMSSLNHSNDWYHMILTNVILIFDVVTQPLTPCLQAMHAAACDSASMRKSKNNEVDRTEQYRVRLITQLCQPAKVSLFPAAAYLHAHHPKQDTSIVVMYQNRMDDDHVISQYCETDDVMNSDF